MPAFWYAQYGVYESIAANVREYVFGKSFMEFSRISPKLLELSEMSVMFACRSMRWDILFFSDSCKLVSALGLDNSLAI